MNHSGKYGKADPPCRILYQAAISRRERESFRAYVPSDQAYPQHRDRPEPSSLPDGTYPLNWLPSRYSHHKFTKLLGTAGISSLNRFSCRCIHAKFTRLPGSAGIWPSTPLTSNPTTRPSSSVPTPYHSPRGLKFSHVPPRSRSSPPVESKNASSTCGPASTGVSAS